MKIWCWKPGNSWIETFIYAGSNAVLKNTALVQAAIKPTIFSPLPVFI
jgi:hypothetical protein